MPVSTTGQGVELLEPVAMAVIARQAVSQSESNR